MPGADCGQGAHTVFAQIAAEALGISVGEDPAGRIGYGLYTNLGQRIRLTDDLYGR